MTPLIVVCTHHKTGTVWMANIFRAIKKQFKRKLYSGRQSELPPDADIFLQDHSRVDLDALRLRGRPVRCVHVIRDPRDVVISGCFYHVKTTEKWANTPRAEFGGKNYREAISALPRSREARLRDEAHGQEVDRRHDQLELPGSRRVRGPLRRADRRHEFRVFRPMMEFVGFRVPSSTPCSKSCDAFPVRGRGRGPKDPVHVRSGESRQWPKTFTPELKAAFSRFTPRRCSAGL
jgi:hypothetical protein